MSREEIILAIINLDNKCKIIFHTHFNFGNIELWNIDDYYYQPDRYYLVENVVEKIWNSENDTKIYEPKLELRKLLRSKEANKYGRGHEAFHKRYLNSGSYRYSELENPGQYLDEIQQDLQKKYNKEIV